MKHLLSLGLAIVIHFSNFLCAQVLSTMDPLVVKSPQAHAMTKYGNIPVRLATGALDLQIPLINLQISGMELGAQLQYDSSGFLPHKKSDIAGMNFSLIAGGRITRELNKVPDEYIGNPTFSGGPFNAGKDFHGFLKGVKTTPSSNTQAYQLFGGTGSTEGVFWTMGPRANGYEGTPDVFHFVAPGLSGKFMVGNDGKILVESDDPNITVDVSQMALYGGTNFCVPPSSTITILRGDGTKYIFGGDLSTYEISYAYGRDPTRYHEFYSSYPMISSFSLKKIIFDYGTKEVNYQYHSGTLGNDFCNLVPLTNAKQNQLLLSLESYTQDGATVSEWKNCPAGVGCGGYTVSENSPYDTFVLLKKSILSSISSENEEIRFTYQDLGYPIKHHKLAQDFLNEWVLKEVELYHFNRLIKKKVLEYQNLGGVYQRPFLSSLSDPMTLEKYNMSYHKTTNLPPYYTKGIDHWGYWNGKDLNTGLAPTNPNSYNSVTGDYQLLNTFRDADPAKADVGLLSKIIYPTGGYSEFQYESHQYGKRLERNSQSNFLPTLATVNGAGGGSRISQVLHYSSPGVLATEHLYRYTTSKDGAQSSGTLMFWPRYLYYFEFSQSQSLQKLLIKTSSNIQKMSLDRYNVGYSKVFEISPGNGHTERNFTSYSSHPDELTPDTSNLRLYFSSGATTTVTPINLYKNYNNLFGINKSGLRAKPLSERYFSEQNPTLVQQEVLYDYYNNRGFNPSSTQDDSNYVTLNHLSGFWVQGYREYLNTLHLKSKTSNTYENGISSGSKQEFFIDSPYHLNVNRTKTTTSSKETFEDKLEFAQDSNPSGAGDLNQRNMKGIPITETRIENLKAKSKTAIQFSRDWLHHEFLFPSQIDQIEANTIGTSNEIGKQKLIFSRYDTKGNLLQYLNEEGVLTSLIWGYHNTKLIAKVTAYSYYGLEPYISAIVSASNSHDQLGTKIQEDALILALDNFRNHAALKDLQITTYTYQPLIGVSTITPPSGERLFFNYDLGGRLVNVKDLEGRIQSEFLYHLKL